ncbi:hypothetical protein AB0B63_06965 [Micromonospora sp. NPDC049081]|uniref:hypothetical protein n=1 Tax=Micromonospora sp. NPDC049081 TaxID=3155150 RepID=UPI0033F5C209
MADYLMWGTDLIRLIDTRIQAARQLTTAVGTVADASGTPVTVTFDGSQLPVPAKVLTHVQVYANARVTLIRHGSDWVVTGVFGGSGDLVAVASDTGSSAAVTSEEMVLALAGFTFEAQTVYRLRLGGQQQGSVANYSLWRVRDRATGPWPVDWGQFGHYPAYSGGNPYALNGEHYLANATDTPVTDQTIAVTAQASTGTTTHIGTPTTPRYLEVHRMPGSPADWPHACPI